MSEDGIEMRVRGWAAKCPECCALVTANVRERNETGARDTALLRDGVLHAMPADCEDQIALCEAVSITTRVKAGTMEPL